MASRKPSGPKPKPGGTKPRRASAVPPAPGRPKAGAAAIAPKPPLSGGQAAKPLDVDMADSTARDDPLPMNKQELIAKVVERSDVPKKHAKPVVEAMLAVLGDALSEGRDLNLQPMGKVKRKRQKDTGKARVIVANIRQSHAARAGAGALANPAPGAPGEAAHGGGKEPVADDAD